MRIAAFTLAALVAGLASLPASLAQESEGSAPGAVTAPGTVNSPPPAFEPQLVRLMEILGAVEVLRGVCGKETGEWRARAEALLDAEADSNGMRRRMIAGYNRGNRAFAAYRACTASAVYAIERYMKEGEDVSRELLVRYGE